MTRRTVLVILVVAALALAFVAGLAAGHRKTFRLLMGMLETQVQGDLNYTVEQLLLVRQGEEDEAIRLLEGQMDAAVFSLPQRRPWEELPGSLQTTLLVAKRYREAYPPPEPSSPQLAQAYASIPDEPIDFGQCRPAIRRFLEEGEGR